LSQLDEESKDLARYSNKVIVDIPETKESLEVLERSYRHIVLYASQGIAGIEALNLIECLRSIHKKAIPEGLYVLIDFESDKWKGWFNYGNKGRQNLDIQKTPNID
jgi:hypothetical protein